MKKSLTLSGFFNVFPPLILIVSLNRNRAFFTVILQTLKSFKVKIKIPLYKSTILDTKYPKRQRKNTKRFFHFECVFSDDVAWIWQIFRDVGFDDFRYSYFEYKATMIITLPFEE